MGCGCWVDGKERETGLKGKGIPTLRVGGVSFVEYVRANSELWMGELETTETRVQVSKMQPQRPQKKKNRPRGFPTTKELDQDKSALMCKL